jgi:hypothetical protein
MFHHSAHDILFLVADLGIWGWIKKNVQTKIGLTIYVASRGVSAIPDSQTEKEKILECPNAEHQTRD